MNIQAELLALKSLNPLQKLILGLILNESPAVVKMVGGYGKTCGEIGNLLGVSRASILIKFNKGIKHVLIASRHVYCLRW